MDITMQEKVSIWFEVTLSYMKLQEDGTEKKVSEMVVVDAVSFTEAEKRALQEMGSIVRGGVEVRNINPAPYKSVFFDESDGEKWYRAKLSFLSIDEATGKEKRRNSTYLVQADTFAQALRNVESVMRGCNDYVTANICETRIMEVYPH